MSLLTEVSGRCGAVGSPNVRVLVAVSTLFHVV